MEPTPDENKNEELDKLGQEPIAGGAKGRPADSEADDCDGGFKPEYYNQKFVPIDSEFLIEHDRLEQLEE